SFVAWTTASSGGLLASDLNGDFKQDLLYFNGQVRGGGNAVFFGNGDGTLTPGTSNLGGASFSAVAVRDLGRDSRHDLVSTSFMDAGVTVWQNASAPRNCGPPISGGLV